MPAKVRKRVAQQIVEAVKDVCGHDINFIDPSGMIFASTNPARVGRFHEIGREAAKRGETIEVERDDVYLGTQRGVNIPLHHQGEVIAVIGITGDPDAVRKYGVLAQKITALILREHELDEQSGNDKAQMNHVIRALVLGEPLNYDYYRAFMERHGVELTGERVTVVVRTGDGANLSSLKSEIHHLFRHLEVTLSTFCYPNEYILLLQPERLVAVRSGLEQLAASHPEALRIGIGSREALSRQARSYAAAQIALQSLAPGQSVAAFDALDLEILLGAVPDEAKARFLERTIRALPKKDRKLLRAYFAAEMSLKRTCEALFLHKNTLQYQLDRIGRDTGYNPRSFPDAVILYLGLKLSEAAEQEN